MDHAALIVVANSLRYEQHESRRQAEHERLEPSLRAGNRRQRKAERLQRRAARAALRARTLARAADAARALAS
jgi:hypothetical protein